MHKNINAFVNQIKMLTSNIILANIALIFFYILRIRSHFIFDNLKKLKFCIKLFSIWSINMSIELSLIKREEAF